MDIGLSIFTNSSSKAPGPLLEIIKATYTSFCSTFRVISPIVFYDPKPNVAVSEEYYRQLLQTFRDVRITQSLADSYYQSIVAHSTEYIFHLEHDWIFDPDNINHTLDEIVDAMEIAQIPHLRFNKRNNVVKRMDKSLEEQQIGTVPVCRTRWISNNPHIINSKIYKNHCLPLFRGTDNHKPGDHEKRMSKLGLSGAIYGGLEHPATVIHLDGRD